MNDLHLLALSNIAPVNIKVVHSTYLVDGVCLKKKQTHVISKGQTQTRVNCLRVLFEIFAMQGPPSNLEKTLYFVEDASQKMQVIQSRAFAEALFYILQPSSKSCEFYENGYYISELVYYFRLLPIAIHFFPKEIFYVHTQYTHQIKSNSL